MRKYIKYFLPVYLTLVTPALVHSAESNKPIMSKHGVVAYTWNSNESIDKANLSTSRYTFNNGRPVTRTRTSFGVYKVEFKGLNCERGQFIVNAYGGEDYKSCRIGSWQGEKDCEVSVYCFNADGKHYDSQFNLVFID